MAVQGSMEDISGELREEEHLLIINRLHQVIRPFMLRRTKSEVEQELPSKIERVIRCRLSAWQKHLYSQISEKVKEDALLVSSERCHCPGSNSRPWEGQTSQQHEHAFEESLQPSISIRGPLRLQTPR